MIEIIDFIKENIQEIVIVVLVIMFLLVLINIKGIDLNAPKPEAKLVQEVTVETFDTSDNIQKLMSSPSELFCDSYLGNSAELEKSCNELTQRNCSDVKCCVYNNGKCVSGDLNGPTYKTDKDGKLITIDSYYYLGKCNGKCHT